MAVRPEFGIEVSSAVETGGTIGALGKLFSSLSSGKLLALIDSVLLTLRSNNPGYVGAAGILLVNLAANVEDVEAVLTRLKESLADTLDAADAAADLAIVRTFPILPQQYLRPLLPKVYQACVRGLMLKCDVTDRALGTKFLCSIIEDVPSEAIQPDALADIVQLSFNCLQFDPDFLKPLHVLTQFGGSIPVYSSQSKLSIEGLFSLLGVDEDRVFAILQKLAKSDDIIAGFQNHFNERELALFGLIGMKSAAQPLSVRVLKVFAAIARSVRESNDKTVSDFKKAAVPMLLGIAEGQSAECKEIAIETLALFVP